MADIFTKKKRSELMSAIRSTGNKSTELKLLAALRSFGITGWRRHQRVLGRPDFLFRREKLAVFVDGCFWHGCSKCRSLPKTRTAFWREKIRSNVARDKKNNAALRRGGFAVLRIWEHDLKSQSRTKNKLIILRAKLANRQSRMSSTSGNLPQI